MAKEFKDYNSKYSAYKGKWMDYEVDNRKQIEAMAAKCDHWFRRDDTVIYNNASVRDAVYESESAEEWQKFRVSLKGFNTAEKLARLEYRWNLMHENLDGEELRREKVRIDNYVYALRRANMLDSNFDIRR